MLQLYFNSDYIEIDNANTDWCKCWLKTSDSNIYLGAESQKYLKDHIVSRINDDLNKSLSEHDFSWVLTFSETHVTLYVSGASNDMTLLFQDASGKSIYTFKLSIERKKQWIRQLKSI